jgi:hypothetical protein
MGLVGPGTVQFFLCFRRAFCEPSEGKSWFREMFDGTGLEAGVAMPKVTARKR